MLRCGHILLVVLTALWLPARLAHAQEPGKARHVKVQWTWTEVPAPAPSAHQPATGRLDAAAARRGAPTARLVTRRVPATTAASARARVKDDWDDDDDWEDAAEDWEEYYRERSRRLRHSWRDHDFFSSGHGYGWGYGYEPYSYRYRRSYRSWGGGYYPSYYGSCGYPTYPYWGGYGGYGYGGYGGYGSGGCISTYGRRFGLTICW